MIRVKAKSNDSFKLFTKVLKLGNTEWTNGHALGNVKELQEISNCAEEKEITNKALPNGEYVFWIWYFIRLLYPAGTLSSNVVTSTAGPIAGGSVCSSSSYRCFSISWALGREVLEPVSDPVPEPGVLAEALVFAGVTIESFSWRKRDMNPVVAACNTPENDSLRANDEAFASADFWCCACR